MLPKNQGTASQALVHALVELYSRAKLTVENPGGHGGGQRVDVDTLRRHHAAGVVEVPGRCAIPISNTVVTDQLYLYQCKTERGSREVARWRSYQHTMIFDCRCRDADRRCRGGRRSRLRRAVLVVEISTSYLQGRESGPPYRFGLVEDTIIRI